MARGRKSLCIVFLSPAKRVRLGHRQRSPTIQAGLAKGARSIPWRGESLALWEMAQRLGVGLRIVRTWCERILNQRMAGRPDSSAAVASQYFPPEVGVHLVKIACQRPDQLGRSLSHWGCRELGRQLEYQGIVEQISAETVRRILAHHKLRP
jgi:hypothetical protein